MAGSTNFMQSRMDNGEVVVRYTDGSTARLALRNPETWWPIEQDYFIDDYQFPLEGRSAAARRSEDRARFGCSILRRSRARARDSRAARLRCCIWRSIRQSSCRALTVRTFANDVVIGLMSVTLERP